MSVRDMLIEFNEKGFEQLQDKINKIDKQITKKKEVNISTKKAQFNLKKFSKHFSKFALGITGAITGAITGVMYGLNKFTDKVDNIVNATSRMGGASTEMVQVLTAIGKEAGFSAEQMEGAFKGMNRIVSDMGITGTTDERFLKLADYIANIKDPAKQSAEAMRIFSETGVKMLPMLKRGSKGFQDYKKAMGKALISKESIDRAMKIKNEMNKLNLALEGVKNSFFDAFTQGFETGDQLHNMLKDMADMDWTPLTNALKEVILLLGDSIKGVNNIFDIIGERRKNLKKESDENAKKYFEDVKKSGGRIDFENEWVYYDGDEKRAPYKERLKSPASEQAFILRGFEELNKKLESYTTRQDSFLDEEKSGEKYNINMKVVDELKKIIENSIIDENKEKARTLLKQLGILPEFEKKAVATTTKTGVAGDYSIKDKKGGRTTSGIGGGVETISVLMHFKNEFTVFARKLLKLQERGTTYGGHKIQDNRPISISVSVTANNKSGKELGDEVAKSISKSLKDILNSNNSIIKSIQQHEETVKEITKDDGRTASIRPSSEPVPNPMA